MAYRTVASYSEYRGLVAILTSHPRRFIERRKRFEDEYRSCESMYPRINREITFIFLVDPARVDHESRRIESLCRSSFRTRCFRLKEDLEENRRVSMIFNLKLEYIFDVTCIGAEGSFRWKLTQVCSKGRSCVLESRARFIFQFL